MAPWLRYLGSTSPNIDHTICSDQHLFKNIWFILSIPGQNLPNSGSFRSIFGFRTQLFGLRAQIFWPGHVKYDIFDPAWPRSFQKYIIYRVKLVYFTTVVWQVLLSRPPPRAIFWSILTDENREQPKKICKPDFSKNCWSRLVSASLGRKFRFPTEVFSCPV